MGRGRLVRHVVLVVFCTVQGCQAACVTAFQKVSLCMWLCLGLAGGDGGGVSTPDLLNCKIPRTLLVCAYGLLLKKYKNEQTSVGHFCGKRAMGAKKNGNGSENFCRSFFFFFFLLPTEMRSFL